MKCCPTRHVTSKQPNEARGRPGETTSDLKNIQSIAIFWNGPNPPLTVPFLITCLYGWASNKKKSYSQEIWNGKTSRPSGFGLLFTALFANKGFQFFLHLVVLSKPRSVGRGRAWGPQPPNIFYEYATLFTWNTQYFKQLFEQCQLATPNNISLATALGPVSRKPWKVLGPVKPFLDHFHLNTEKCIRLKLLVWREPPFIFRICAKQLCNCKVRDFAMALGATKVSGAFEKRTPETLPKGLDLLFCLSVVYNLFWLFSNDSWSKITFKDAQV